MLSVDLTTLPGWASLSDGSHNITIVAKADGYADSEPSAAVSVTKATTPTEDELAGTWVFNDRLFGGTLGEILDIEFIFNFDSSGSHFTSLGISQNTRPDNEILYMAFGDLGQVYSTQQFDDDDTTSNRWLAGEEYKTITITSKLSEVTDGDTLLAFLQSNATKQ